MICGQLVANRFFRVLRSINKREGFDKVVATVKVPLSYPQNDPFATTQIGTAYADANKSFFFNRNRDGSQRMDLEISMASGKCGEIKNWIFLHILKDPNKYIHKLILTPDELKDLFEAQLDYKKQIFECSSNMEVVFQDSQRIE